MGINTVAVWPQHNQPDGTWCRWSACHAAGTGIVCPSGCPESESSIPGPAPLKLGDEINGGIIIAYRVLPGPDGAGRWAAIMVFRREETAERYVVAQIPTGRRLTSWALGNHFRSLWDAVHAFER